jgi:hypothetical protein
MVQTLDVYSVVRVFSNVKLAACQGWAHERCQQVGDVLDVYLQERHGHCNLNALSLTSVRMMENLLEGSGDNAA